jgi:disulfide bond formation protein DsbB
MKVFAPLLDRWPLAAAGLSALMLAIAHSFERFGGLLPCHLCYLQRHVYWIALAAGLAGAVLLRLWRDARARPLVCVVLAAVFLYGAGLAAYHAGAEWKWWPGPSTCTAGGSMALTPEAMSDLLAGRPIEAPACDEAQWIWLGLSMAGWNALVSLALSLVSVWAALRGRVARSAAHD